MAGDLCSACIVKYTPFLALHTWRHASHAAKPFILTTLLCVCISHSNGNQACFT